MKTHETSIRWLHRIEGITLCFLFLSLFDIKVVREIAVILLCIMIFQIFISITFTLLDERKKKREIILKETEWWKVKEFGGWV